MRCLQQWLVATLFFCSAAASACAVSQTQDVLNDPQRHYERATYVVLAKVVSATKIDQHVARLELDIQRSLKGSPGPTMTLLNFLGSDCSQWLEAGQQYLIFARPESYRDNKQYMLIGLTGEEGQRVLQQLTASK